MENLYQGCSNFCSPPHHINKLKAVQPCPQDYRDADKNIGLVLTAMCQTSDLDF